MHGRILIGKALLKEKMLRFRVHACTSAATAVASISSKHNTKRSKLVMCFDAVAATATVAASDAFLWFLLSMFSLLYVLFCRSQKCFKFFSASIYCIIHFIRAPLFQPLSSNALKNWMQTPTHIHTHARVNYIDDEVECDLWKKKKKGKNCAHDNFGEIHYS